MKDNNFAKEQFSSMPGWAKGVIAIGILAGVGFVAYKVIKGINERNKHKGSKKEDNAVNNDLDKLISAGQGPTMSQSQMIGFANQLFQAMDGYGTNEESIISIFNKVKNDADVLGIIKSYGIKDLSSGKFNPEPNLKGTLREHLSAELSQYWMDALNKVMTNKKITTRF